MEFKTLVTMLTDMRAEFVVDGYTPTGDVMGSTQRTKDFAEAMQLFFKHPSIRTYLRVELYDDRLDEPKNDVGWFYLLQRFWDKYEGTLLHYIDLDFAKSEWGPEAD